MRILVGWDNPIEAETIELILNVDESTASIFTDADQFEAAVDQGNWDVVLMATNFPNEEAALELFKKVQDVLSNSPVVGAWKQGEFTNLARFISLGLHSHLMRDSEGDYIFLIPSMMEAALAAAIAQKSRALAERLREEVDSVRRLQESVIPRDLPAPPGYEVVARYEPHRSALLATCRSSWLVAIITMSSIWTATS